MPSNRTITIGFFILVVAAISFRLFFTEEAQNKMNRSFTSTFGVKNGAVDIFDGGAVVFRMFNVEKLSTAMGTDDNNVRNYRYGYGYQDKNLDGILTEDEKDSGKTYFELSNFSKYVYYDFGPNTSNK